MKIFLQDLTKIQFTKAAWFSLDTVKICTLIAFKYQSSRKHWRLSSFPLYFHIWPIQHIVLTKNNLKILIDTWKNMIHSSTLYSCPMPCCGIPQVRDRYNCRVTMTMLPFNYCPTPFSLIFVIRGIFNLSNKMTTLS